MSCLTRYDANSLLFEVDRNYLILGMVTDFAGGPDCGAASSKISIIYLRCGGKSDHELRHGFTFFTAVELLFESAATFACITDQEAIVRP